MIFEETLFEKGKQISYVRYGNWTDNIILFFHGFTVQSALFQRLKKIMKCVYYPLTDRVSEILVSKNIIKLKIFYILLTNSLPTKI